MLAPPPPAIVWQLPQEKPTLLATPFECDVTGVIRCAVTETVTANRATEDTRLIATYISLLSARNQRHFLRWGERLPSAAYELVRRVRSFPYLPYGDVYGIADMQLILQASRDRILVRYPKRPNDRPSERLESDYVTYETPLAAFIKTVEREVAKLKKNEKLLPE